MFDSIHQGDDLRPVWPEDVPFALELRLLDALSYRSCNQMDIWDEVKTWLEDNDVAPTEQIVRAPSSRFRMVRGCRKFS